MSKDWRTIFKFVGLGFAFAVIYGGYQLARSSSSNPSVDGMFILLCPVTLLFAPLFAYFFEAAELGTALFYLLWLLVALANAALYAVVGAAYVGLRKKPDKPATN